MARVVLREQTAAMFVTVGHSRRHHLGNMTWTGRQTYCGQIWADVLPEVDYDRDACCRRCVDMAFDFLVINIYPTIPKEVPDAQTNPG